jgi:hypothetical protein
VSGRNVTLLIENLYALVAAAGTNERYPALETALTRGKRQPAPYPRFDRIRFSLCGFNAEQALPIAAVTRLADGGGMQHGDSGWLRADPVTMQADMTRVFMTGFGTRDLDDKERSELAVRLQILLRQEGLYRDAAHPDRWYLALPEPVSFEFTPLEQALGVDIAEVFPAHPEALAWRRLMNEVQMALHAHPVNEARRGHGRPEINSLWFWGAGQMPDRPGRAVFEQVYSACAVTMGISRLSGVEPQTIGTEYITLSGASTLVDWPPEICDPAAELARIDRLVDEMLAPVRKGERVLEVHAGTGPGRIDSWRLDSRASRRIWRRPQALQALIDAN